MGVFIDLTGWRFGSLVLSRQAPRESGRTWWHAACDCGRETIVRPDQLKTGHTVSCGCVGAQRLAERRNKHGLARTRTYRIWQNMKTRCHTPSHMSFPDYGGAGIRVCERWESFEPFVADMGMAPEDLSIDRIDGSKGYEPSNCRWATSAEQARNKRSNVNLTWQGETMCLADWASRLNMSVGTLYQRVVRSGWPLERAFKRPVSLFGDRQARRGS